jgi:uncharacterized protein YfbU (UPF0304 family)
MKIKLTRYERQVLVNQFRMLAAIEKNKHFNSHMQTLDTYERMVTVYKEVRKERHAGALSEGQLLQILAAKGH